MYTYACVVYWIQTVINLLIRMCIELLYLLSCMASDAVVAVVVVIDAATVIANNNNQNNPTWIKKQKLKLATILTFSIC